MKAIFDLSRTTVNRIDVPLGQVVDLIVYNHDVIQRKKKSFFCFYLFFFIFFLFYLKIIFQKILFICTDISFIWQEEVMEDLTKHQTRKIFNHWIFWIQWGNYFILFLYFLLLFYFIFIIFYYFFILFVFVFYFW